MNLAAIQSIMIGVGAGNYWLFLKNCERYDVAILSTVSAAVFAVR